MMRNLLLASATALALAAGPVLAQSTPNWALGFVPSPADWNGLWAGKLDLWTGTTGARQRIVIGNAGLLDSEPLLSGVSAFSNIAGFSSVAGNGVVGATKTSDGSSPGAQGAWAVGGFAFNDNASAVQTAYAGYYEARRQVTGAGVTHGIEIDLTNQGDVVENDPYFIGSTGATLGLWVGTGRAGLPSQADATLAIGVVGFSGNPAWRKGLVFGYGSVYSRPGVGNEAVVMPSGYTIDWYGADRAVTALIRSDINASPGARPTGIVFTGNGGILVSAGGTASGNELQWSNDNVVIKALTVSGQWSVPKAMILGIPGTYVNDAGAAADGVALFGMYVDTSGFLRQRRS